MLYPFFRNNDLVSSSFIIWALARCPRFSRETLCPSSEGVSLAENGRDSTDYSLQCSHGLLSDFNTPDAVILGGEGTGEPRKRVFKRTACSATDHSGYHRFARYALSGKETS